MATVEKLSADQQIETYYRILRQRGRCRGLREVSGQIRAPPCSRVVKRRVGANWRHYWLSEGDEGLSSRSGAICRSIRIRGSKRPRRRRWSTPFIKTCLALRRRPATRLSRNWFTVLGGNHHDQRGRPGDRQHGDGRESDRVPKQGGGGHRFHDGHHCGRYRQSAVG